MFYFFSYIDVYTVREQNLQYYKATVLFMLKGQHVMFMWH